MKKIGILSLVCCTSVFATQSQYDDYAAGNRALGAKIAQLDSEKILAEETRLAPLASDLLLRVKPMIRQGGSGIAIQNFLLKQFSHYGWRPMAVGYKGYPEAVPVSVNNQVGNALPTDMPFPDAALVKVELIAASPQAHVAQAWTFATPNATEQQRQLLMTARHALQSGIKEIRAGERLSNVGNAIQQALDANQVVAVHELVGYSMGQMRIQNPQVLGYKSTLDDETLMKAGQVLNVYVVAKSGDLGVQFQPPELRTVLTQDGEDSVMLSAMVEVTHDGHRMLSRLID
ncbi:M24 family metallopeptidase [Pseudomonas antarctica]|uniref:Methionine aminopeptidase n=1 Tax=Pseudomonas antarctica TaxID=219572 RepID=A0A1G9Z345_9PSED|nr:M24 family metallopeptidase [Pseudomonas antarctica]KAF2410967.1 methionine aminopeptidase 1 [Pseudomonas antarctica]SDN15617.1 Methionine aminopeptidase [Pseudomonas antarctica]